MGDSKDFDLSNWKHKHICLRSGNLKIIMLFFSLPTLYPTYNIKIEIG